MEIQNSKDWAKVYRACGFIEKGVCEYADERVYLSEETLIKSLHTIKGRPVIIDHMTGITPENMNEHAVGYVVDYEVQGACDCKFVIFDDEGKKVIADGYSVSCAYKPKSFGPGGTWHNVPYDREITDLEYTHLALVQNPRYEDAKVYENAKDRDGGKGRWITIKGTHVFIKDGQSVEDAMKETFKDKSSDEHDKLRGDIGKAIGHYRVSAEGVAKELGVSQRDVVRHLDDMVKSGDVEYDAPSGTYRRLRKSEIKGDSLKGKYAKEDADFNVDQMKKDIKAAQSLGHESIEDVAEFLGLDEDEVRETIGEGDRSGSSFDEEGFKKFVEANKKKEKHNSIEQLEEENMRVDEFFNKMGEMIEEKLNACKSKMNEGDEEEKEDDDDKFEMDGEVYSKKELVNAWKEKKNAEESEEKSDEESEEESKKKSDEEEKQNSGDEFFNAMEKRMQQQANANANDKIEIYSQAKGLEKGRSIYTK